MYTGTVAVKIPLLMLG